MQSQTQITSSYHRARFYLLFNPIKSLSIVSALISVAVSIDYYLSESPLSLITYTGYFGAFLLFYLNHRSKSMHDVFHVISSFNDRYSKINQKLAEKNGYTGKHFAKDYINLCAEEYFYYMQGQIPEQVWNVWFAGMKAEWADNPVKDVAVEEFRSKSTIVNQQYYGFDPYALGLLVGADYIGEPDTPRSA